MLDLQGTSSPLTSSTHSQQGNELPSVVIKINASAARGRGKF